MFLNCLAQATLLTNCKTYLNFDEFKDAPLLLCHKNALDGKPFPPDWSGTMCATEEVLREVEQKGNMIKRSTQILHPNEAYNIKVTNDVECHYEDKNIEITALPWDKENTIYLIKDSNVTNLLTDIITEDMTIFVENKILRNSIKTGIDVLFVNDGVYHNSIELSTFPSECLLGTLVTLVRPRYVKGLISEEQLPPHFANCCMDLCG